MASPVYNGNRIAPNEFPIYHVHGFMPQDLYAQNPNPVLLEEDYHDLYKNSFAWSNVEQLHALSRTTCFFIGMSMMDPNLRRLLEFAYLSGEGSTDHFVFLPRGKFSKEPLSSQEQDDRNCTVLETALNELGVSVIWFEDFQELPKLIGNLYS